MTALSSPAGRREIGAGAPGVQRIAGHEAGVEPRPTVETNSISTMFAHVRDGHWSSVMAHAWLHVFDVPAGMRVIPLVAPTTTSTVGLVWPDRDPESILARALLDVAGKIDVEGALRS
jgi:DNA-binding transcriptional LysR family regulator